MFLRLKKIETDASAQKTASLTHLCRAGFFLFFILIITPVFPCDLSAFEQNDFADRCQLLLDISDKLSLARRFGHPDQIKLSGELSREWVRFYLAHGSHSTMPPSLNFIATETWEAGVKETGIKLASFNRNKATLADEAFFRYKIELLKAPEQIRLIHQELKNRQIYTHAEVNLAEIDLWFTRNLINTASAIADRLGNNQILYEKLNSEIEFHIGAKERIKELKSQGFDETALNGLIKNLQNEINEEMKFWESLFYFAT